MQENKFYLTKEGLKRFQQEYEKLIEFKRAKVKGEIPSMLHSEEPNPEYLTFQEDMTLLEARLAEYGNILQNAQVIKRPSKTDQDKVGLGATVTVSVDDGQIDEFQLIGTLEASPSQGKISDESPVGKAFLGKKVGDEAVVSSPTKTTYKIKKIRYVSSYI